MCIHRIWEDKKSSHGNCRSLHITNIRSSKTTQGWWRKFLEKQKDLSLRRGDNTSQDRMDAIDSETLENYFTLLKKTLEENNLKNSPQWIYNVDESGVPLDPKGLNIRSC